MLSPFEQLRHDNLYIFFGFQRYLKLTTWQSCGTCQSSLCVRIMAMEWVRLWNVLLRLLNTTPGETTSQELKWVLCRELVPGIWVGGEAQASGFWKVPGRFINNCVSHLCDLWMKVKFQSMSARLEGTFIPDSRQKKYQRYQPFFMRICFFTSEAKVFLYKKKYISCFHPHSHLSATTFFIFCNWNNSILRLMVWTFWLCVRQRDLLRTSQDLER